MSKSTITVAGINPGLRILGANQQFNYDQQTSTFQLTNSFIPIIGIPSQLVQEFRNNLYSGFRFKHVTTTTDTFGSFTLQSFLNAQTTGNDIIKFDNAGIDILSALNLNGQTGSSGQVLTSQGAGNAPIWTTNGDGTVTSITAGAGLSGGTITTSGTIDITDTSVVPGTYNGSFTVNSRGQLTAASNELRGILAYLYMTSNTTPTVITNPNDWAKILGTTISTITNDFTATSNRFTYNGTNNITALVKTDLTAIPTLTSTLSISIYKNGSPVVTSAINRNYQLTASKPINLTVEFPIQFTTNDYVEVWISSDNTDTNLIVSEMNFQITL